MLLSKIRNNNKAAFTWTGEETTRNLSRHATLGNKSLVFQIYNSGSIYYT